MRLVSSLCLLILVSMANAQPNPEPKDGKITIPLTLTPTPIPKPLSRYYLTPQYKEQQPGNRVPSYMKAYMEQAAFFSKDPAAEREKWNLMKLEELPVDKVKESGCTKGRPLADVDEGSRMLSSDWQIWFQLRRDGLGMLLPEVQKMRELAGALKVRMRYEIATQDFEKAAYTARTFFGLVQAFETHPTTIGALVGMAIEAICLNAIEEMIQQPGCPNLYWSLTEVPPDAFNMRIPIQGEKFLVEPYFGALMNAKGELPDADVKQVIRQYDGLTRNGDEKQIKAFQHFTELAKDANKVAAARAYLVETGTKPDLVKLFSALQVVVTKDVRRYEVDLDDVMSLYGLPISDAGKRSAELEAMWKGDKERRLSEMLPNSYKARQAQVRLQQRVAYLRVIEAIRLHAFDNAGKLPAELKDVKSPLPKDPVTGDGFVYSVKDGVATLTGGNPNPGQANTNRVYEIAIRK